MSKHKQRFSSIQSLRALLIIVIFGIAMFVILPQLGGFQNSLHVLASADWRLVILATCMSLCAPFFGGVVYSQLALKPIPVRESTLVQFSGLFINRILPAGIGGLGLNIWYLRKRRHSLSESAVVVGLNNSLGLIGHVLLLMVFVLVFPRSLTALHYTTLSSQRVVIVFTVVILIVLALGIVFRRRIAMILRDVGTALRHVVTRARRQPERIATALFASMALTLSSVLSFWLCCVALHAVVTLPLAFMLYTASAFIGTATPTPGGIGGVEAALYVGLTGLAIPSALALAIALLFRLVSFWFGLFIGGFCAWYMQQRIL